MSFGLSPDGFQRARLADLVTQIQTAITDAFGAVNLDPDSVLGELSSIVAVPIAELWMEAENVYHSQYPSTAEGTSLDNAVDLVGISRIAANQTRVTIAVGGTTGTSIPVGSQVRIPETGEIFESTMIGVIGNNNAVIISGTTNTVVDNTDYTVIIAGNTITIDSGVTATSLSIIAGLVSAINLAGLEVVAVDNLDTTFKITANTNDDAFNFTSSNNLLINSRSTPIQFVAVNTGPVLAIAHTVTEIVTPVAGWTLVDNLEDGVLGRDVETDQELRLRRLQSLRVLGGGSVEAIQARLRQSVASVLNALVFENRQPYIVDGRPGHSFEAVVEGGDDQEIADLLWLVKPAGIETYGNVTINVTDSNNDLQAISFSRPEPIYIWINVDLRVNPGSFPSDGLTAVASALKAFGDTFGVGERIIYQQFFAPIYTVDGILEVEVLEFATSATEMGPPGAYSSANIIVTEVETGIFSTARINVII